MAEELQELYAVTVNEKGYRWTADLVVQEGKITGKLFYSGKGFNFEPVACSRGKIKAEGKFKIYCKGTSSYNRFPRTVFKGDLQQAKMGSTIFTFVTGEEKEQFLAELEKNPDLTTDPD